MSFGEAPMTPPSAKSKPDFQLVAEHDARLGLPSADDDVCEPFSRWLDDKLAELVDRWLHLAAPNASRRERASLGRRR